MATIRHKINSLWLLLIFFLPALGFVGGGVAVYHQQAENYRNQVHNGLAAVSDLKVHQIVAWMDERRAHAVVLAENPFFCRSVADYQQAQGAEKARLGGELATFFLLLTRQQDYLTADLLSPQGERLVGSDPQSPAIGIHAQELLAKARERGIPVLSDLHRANLVHPPHLDCIIPVAVPGRAEGGRKTVVAYVLLRLDPSRTLYPLIQRWPTPSASAETLLVRGENGRVLYLNELRFQKNTALRLSSPLSSKWEPTVKAILGAAGPVDGMDYRGVGVLTYVSAVPGTSWKLLSKVDCEEVDAALQEEARGTIAIVALLSLVSALLVALLWYQREAKFRREKLVADLQQAALTKHFDLAMRHASDIILLADENQCIIEANDRALKVYGYSRGELIGMPGVRLRPPEQAEAFAETARKVLQERNLTFETVHCRKDGSTFPVEASLHVVPIQGHTFYQAIIRDITARRKIAATLQAERDSAQRYLDVVGVAIVVLDAAGRITQVNRAGCEMLGWESPAELLGKDWYAVFVPPEESEARRALYRRMLASGVPTHTGRPGDENRVVTRTGEERILHFTDRPVREADGRITGVIFSATDITERLRMEARLEHINRIYVMMSEINQAVIRTNNRDELFRMVCDSVVQYGKFRLAWIGLLERASGKITPVVQAGVSDGYVEKLDISIYPDQRSGQGPVGRAIRDNRCVFINNFEEESVLMPRQQQAAARGYSGFAVVPLRVGGAPAGILVIYASEQNLFGADEIKLIEEIGTDINFAIAKMEGEESHRLAESSRLRLAMVVEQTAEGVIITDMEGRMTYVNPAFEKMSGYAREEALGHNPHLLKSGKVAPEIYAQMWRNLRAGESWHGELVNKRKDGAFYEVEATLSPIRDEGGGTVGFVGTTRDITREKQLERQFMQAQKMETVGRLAGGVAHDFNNILQVVMGFCSMLLESMSPTDKHRTDVAEIQKAGRRATDLTRQLLAFSRKQVIEFKVIDVNLLVTGMNNMLRRLIGENIRLETKLAADLKRTKADSGQIEQVLMNLVVNARDAMPEGGALTLASDNVSLTETAVREASEARPGEFVCLTVADTGHGMTEYVRSHLFEPFFTTKGVGKGTGMGLATVYGIVKQHEGWIDVESEQGRGSSFRVFLPVSEGAVEAWQASSTTPSVIPRGNRQRILLVEDEPAVRQLAERLLTNNGYTVFPVAGVQEALELFQRDGRRFDLLLSDVVLEDGTGIELAEKLLTLKPKLPVIMCSGYADDEARRELIQSCGYRFLHKPYRQAQLLTMVNEVLAGSR